jgi:hypothetical protein
VFDESPPGPPAGFFLAARINMRIPVCHFAQTGCVVALETGQAFRRKSPHAKDETPGSSDGLPGLCGEALHPDR